MDGRPTPIITGRVSNESVQSIKQDDNKVFVLDREGHLYTPSESLVHACEGWDEHEALKPLKGFSSVSIAKKRDTLNIWPANMLSPKSGQFDTKHHTNHLSKSAW